MDRILKNYNDQAFNQTAEPTPANMENVQRTLAEDMTRQTETSPSESDVSLQLPMLLEMCDINQPEDNQNNQAVVQLNGRKVFGPPENWVGPVPDYNCEIYVRRIPKNLNAQALVHAFLRFGRLYEIRLPLDYQQLNRGYAYVKYTNEEDAGAALDVMCHFYIVPGVKFDTQKSYEKCRLFVSNIPRGLDETEIAQKLRLIFPRLQRVYLQDNARHRFENNNFYFTNGQVMQTLPTADCQGDDVIVEFQSHSVALAAKKSTNPGVIRLWGRDLIVSWANSEADTDLSNSNKTLYIRNVDLTVNPRDISELLLQFLNRAEIVKVTRVRTSAFVDFATREAAESIMQILQGAMYRNRRLEIEWARPSEQRSLHRLRDLDFDAVLRLKCIANNWSLPIILFGTYYNDVGIQYGAIIMRNSHGETRAIFCIMQPYELVDIQARMCEVVCVLIETIGNFPDCNYVFFVQRDTAHMLGIVIHTAMGVIFSASHSVPAELAIDLNEITDLSYAVAVLTSKTETNLIVAYQESLRFNSNCNYLVGYDMQQRTIAAIMPKYRNKPPLRYNLNDSQIVLILCYSRTGTNIMLPERPHLNLSAAVFDSGYTYFHYMTLNLLPIAVTQSRLGTDHMISHVIYDGNHAYMHPKQRLMIPPVWITVCPYSVSIKQPPSANNSRTSLPLQLEPSTSSMGMQQAREQQYTNGFDMR